MINEPITANKNYGGIAHFHISIEELKPSEFGALQSTEHRGNYLLRKLPGEVKPGSCRLWRTNLRLHKVALIGAMPSNKSKERRETIGGGLYRGNVRQRTTISSLCEPPPCPRPAPLEVDSDDMSINSNNMFPSYLENPPRATPSQQTNGNGGGMISMNVGMPMNAGQQMDVNMLYQKVLELSEVLRENREKTQGIVSGAEELAVSQQPLWIARSRNNSSIGFFSITG